MLRDRTALPDAPTLGLQALGAIAADPPLLARLLDVTGLMPADLRGRAGSPGLLAAVLGFLEAHEPDLIAVAAAIGVRPADLIAARVTLERA